MSDQTLDEPLKYRAFLSYRTSDARQAAWLHKKLEEYVVPRSLVGTQGDHGIVPRRLGTIFRDRDEMRSSEHIEIVITQALSRSQQLIVLCTPNAVMPDSWVPREIELFRQHRPNGWIHAVIGAGSPPTCFPSSLLTTAADGTIDAPLAADLRPLREGGADGEDKGVVRLIAGLLGVRFDDLWRREERRRRIRYLTRSVELAAAGAATIGIIALGNYYRTHAMVDVDAASVLAAAANVRIVGTEEMPVDNGSRVFEERPLSSGRIRVYVPASNVILRLRANYRDGVERGLALHLKLTSGFGLSAKRLRFRLPSAEEILAHPGMAYIPVTQWIHGSENQNRTNATPFWIDLRPPMVAKYVPVAEGLVNAGDLNAENSIVLVARRQASAVERTGLGQLQSLNRGLGEIIGVISQASSPSVSAPGDIVAGMVQLPCDSCPAPMTRHEAEVFCQSRAMRLSSALEWELAARGVDGRVYPWGNRFDASRANVAGLPEKGSQPALTPVGAHREQTSPFELYDTVGNAGDWVVNDVSSYERVYMGATYRFNPEDATTFRMLPVIDSV